MIKLSDGKEIQLDLYKLTIAEVREIISGKRKDDGDDLLGRVVGMTAKQLAALPFPDYRRITREFSKALNDPLAYEELEKNSLSESS